VSDGNGCLTEMSRGNKRLVPLRWHVPRRRPHGRNWAGSGPAAHMSLCASTLRENQTTTIRGNVFSAAVNSAQSAYIVPQMRTSTAEDWTGTCHTPTQAPLTDSGADGLCEHHNWVGNSSCCGGLLHVAVSVNEE